LLPNLSRLSGYGLIMASGFTLATIVQRKMEWNDCCSPDLSNDRRQNDGVVLAPSIGQFRLFKGSAASCCALAICSRDPAPAIAHPLFDLQ
jgi:hypothetical protein